MLGALRLPPTAATWTHPMYLADVIAKAKADERERIKELLRTIPDRTYTMADERHYLNAVVLPEIDK